MQSKEQACSLKAPAGVATAQAAAADGVARTKPSRWRYRALRVLGAMAMASVVAAPLSSVAPGSRQDTTPPRKTVGLALQRTGWTYDCMECHTLLRAKWHYDLPVNEHRQVQLAHGNNRFCLNCHHPENRNAWVDYDGAEIPQADVVQLCAKCHGTIFRDWQAGVHGRENGFWRTSVGPKAKLRCIQCHDPHRPQFPAMKPLAPLRYPPRAAHPPTAQAAAAHPSH